MSAIATAFGGSILLILGILFIIGYFYIVYDEYGIEGFEVLFWFFVYTLSSIFFVVGGLTMLIEATQ